MNCELAQTTVHGYFDGELDAVRSAEFERHLTTCTECQFSLDSMNSLQARLQHSELCHPASSHLREQLRKELHLTTSSARFAAPRLRRHFWVPVLAALALAAGSAFFLRTPKAQSARITAELIDAHVRSLQPGHLTDIPSTDQHTVKPWFDGKLDFIPPVSDYSTQGFPLAGGRLDVIDGHNVAGLVYARRKHFINLFVWPATGTNMFSESSGSRQGYNWMMWRSGEMQFCLVSDASSGDLRELKHLIDR